MVISINNCFGLRWQALLDSSLLVRNQLHTWIKIYATLLLAHLLPHLILGWAKLHLQVTSQYIALLLITETHHNLNKLTPQTQSLPLDRSFSSASRAYFSHRWSFSSHQLFSFHLGEEIFCRNPAVVNIGWSRSSVWAGLHHRWAAPDNYWTQTGR